MAQTVYALDSSGKLVTVEADDFTSLYRDLITDRLYGASGTAVEALFTASSRLEGTWKRRIVLDKPANFGWLAVESDFLDKDGATARSVVVTVYNAAGTVLSTSTVSSRTPVRLPQMREREVIVGVVSKAIVTRVTLASTADELKVLT
jgi:hypothetical protein